MGQFWRQRSILVLCILSIYTLLDSASIGCQSFFDMPETIVMLNFRKTVVPWDIFGGEGQQLTLSVYFSN